MKPKIKGDLGTRQGLGRGRKGGKEGENWVSPAERGLIGMCISFSLFGWGEADASKCWQR